MRLGIPANVLYGEAFAVIFVLQMTGLSFATLPPIVIVTAIAHLTLLLLHRRDPMILAVLRTSLLYRRYYPAGSHTNRPSYMP